MIQKWKLNIECEVSTTSPAYSLPVTNSCTKRCIEVKLEYDEIQSDHEDK